MSADNDDEITDDEEGEQESEDKELDRIVDQILRRLYRGGTVDWSACYQQYPQQAEKLEQLRPIMEAVVMCLREKYG